MNKKKKMSVSKYGFPKKLKIVNAKRGRPKKMRLRKPEAYEAFCEWAAKPTPLKEQKTAKEFGKLWGVTSETLSKWKHRQDFWEKVASWRREWAKDKTSDVVHGLWKRAKTRGEAAEVKLWMQLIEDWSEKTAPPTQNITVIGIRGITQSDLENLKKQPNQGKLGSEEAEVIES
jgi:hypothetical protein